MAWTYFQKLGKGNMCFASKFHSIHGFYEIVHVPTVCIKNNRFTKLFKNEKQNSNQWWQHGLAVKVVNLHAVVQGSHLALSSLAGFLFLVVLNTTVTCFFFYSKLFYYNSHTMIDLFLSPISQTHTKNCNLHMLMAWIVA